MFAANEAAETDTGQQHRVHLTANATGPGRTEALMGRTYRVVPATLVRSQVLHNNIGRCYLPADAITPEWAEVANGAPVLIDHPMRDGQPVSGRDPDVWNGSASGFLFRTRAQSGALKGEVWLDEGRAEDVEGLSAILAQLDDGRTVELSTGFPALGEEVQGVHNGEEYDLVLHPTGFDHLAVFADKVGACSVDDGCGLGALNEDTETDPAKGVATRIWAHLKALVTQQDEWSLDDTREAVHEALKMTHGADDRWIYIEELFEGSVVYGVDEERDGERRLFRAPYTIDREAGSAMLGESTEVEKITEFVPVENGAGIQARHEFLAIHEKPPKEGDMNRKELLAALCACDKVRFSKETLEKMTDEELAHVANTAGVGPEGEGAAEPAEEEAEEKPGATEATEGESEPAEAPAETENLKAVQASIQALRKEIADLKEATEPARNQTAEERTRLVSDIAANSEFEEDELKGKPLTELRKLHKATCQKPANFAGMGLPRRSDPSTRSVNLGFEVPDRLSTPKTREN